MQVATEASGSRQGSTDPNGGASSSIPQPRGECLPGCYTVVWSPRPTRDEPHYIKLAPTFGDGDTSRWPEEGPEMTLLDNDHDKQRMWRKTAGEMLAKDLGHHNNETAAHWMLADLPKGYALFEQITRPKNDAIAREGTKRLRLDRFIFGHDGRKIRSALSLGKHISWQLFNKPGHCPCDGCKLVGKAGAEGGSPAKAGGAAGARKRKVTGEGLEEAGEDSEVSSRGRARAGKTARTAASKKAAAKGKGGKKGKGRDWDDEDDEDEPMYDDFPYDEDDGGYSSDYGRGLGGPGSASRTTSSGRQSKPTVKLQEAEPINDDISNFMTPAPPEFAATTSTLSVEEVQLDLRAPRFLRVGELVWVRVPLGRPPSGQRKFIGDADFSRWPGIIRKRTVKGKGDDTDAKFTVELLSQNSNDSLEMVRSENVMPWLQFIPANTAHMDKHQWTWNRFRQDGVRKGWTDIQTEGWPAVVGAYWKAHRIAKCYAAIQIRPLPTIAVGEHLASNLGRTSSVRSELEEFPARSRYLTYSHVIYGPELIHVGDFVRLKPGSDLGPFIDRKGFDPKHQLLATTLILHISIIYQGLGRSPLMARGVIYELVEMPDREDPNYALNPQATAQELSLSILKTLPRPFPSHKWRCLSTAHGEVDLCFSDIAGRYYPLTKKDSEELELVNVALKKSNQQVDNKADLLGWAVSLRGRGMNGFDALRLTLSGLCGAFRTTQIIAENGAMGGRDDQLRLAEEQAEADIPAGVHGVRMGPPPEVRKSVPVSSSSSTSKPAAAAAATTSKEPAKV